MPPSLDDAQADPHPRRLPWLGLAILVLASSAATGIAYSPDYLSSDAAQHLSVASNLLAGRGVATSLVYYDEHHRLGGIPVPQTVFPPGFAIVIALVSRLGLDLQDAAFLVCLGSFSALSLLAAAVLRRAGHAWWVALSGAGALAFSVAAATNVLTLSSDVPFAATTLAALLCLQRVPAQGPGWALVAGVLAALAFSFRYSGIFFMLSLGVVLAARAALLRTRRAFVDLAATLLVPLVSMAIVLGRNLFLVGDWKGGNAHLIARPLREVGLAFLWGIRDLFGYSRAGLVEGRPREVFALATLALLTVLAALSRPRWRSPATGVSFRDPATSLSVVYAALSLLLLWELERTRHLGVSGRMLLPLFPFLLLLVAEITRHLRWSAPRVPSYVAAGLLATVYLVGQTTLVPPRRLAEAALTVRTIKSALQTIHGEGFDLAGPPGRSGPLVANEPQLVGAVAGLPVVGLTSPEYTGRRWTVDETYETVRRYGVRYVLFLPGPFTRELQENQDFFRDLAAGKVPPWLETVRGHPAFMLFEVRSNTPLRPKTAGVAPEG